MNITLDYLTGNRKWLVKDFLVWGTSGAIEGELIFTEVTNSGKRIVFTREISGGTAQEVNFSDLIDHRGNRLPQTIKNPAILIIPKNQTPCFVAGAAGSGSFRIAKSDNYQTSGMIDLLIMEMN